MAKSSRGLSSAFKGSSQENDRADIIDTLMPATVNIAITKDGKAGAGSGFIYDSANGYIVTNHHVVNGATDIKILTNDDRILNATVIGSDKYTDIAIVQVKSKTPLPQAKLGDSDKMRVGHDVIAIGAPMGLAGTVTTGIISAKDRDIGAGPYDQLLQHDASVNPGNSGGPLFNSAGEVIGVNAMIISRSGTSAGISLAIPINQAQWVAEHIIADGAIRWGYLGATVSGIPEEERETLKLTDPRGVAIRDVAPDGPAARGGLRAGDIVLAINGMDVKAARFLTREIAKVTADKQALLDIWRDGTQQTLSVTVGARPVEPDRPARSYQVPEPDADAPHGPEGNAGPENDGEQPLIIIPRELLPYLQRRRPGPQGPEFGGPR